MSEIVENQNVADQVRSKEQQSNNFRSAIPWLSFNLALLVLYVGFFHLCLITDFPVSLIIGFAIAGLMGFLCVRWRRLFTNRYEFFFYLALPLYVALESLIPFHSGYSFYWCAVAFWSVFGAYRIYLLLRVAKSS